MCDPGTGEKAYEPVYVIRSDSKNLCWLATASSGQETNVAGLQPRVASEERLPPSCVDNLQNEFTQPHTASTKADTNTGLLYDTNGRQYYQIPECIDRSVNGVEPVLWTHNISVVILPGYGKCDQVPHFSETDAIVPAWFQNVCRTETDNPVHAAHVCMSGRNIIPAKTKHVPTILKRKIRSIHSRVASLTLQANVRRKNMRKEKHIVRQDAFDNESELWLTTAKSNRSMSTHKNRGRKQIHPDDKPLTPTTPDNCFPTINMQCTPTSASDSEVDAVKWSIFGRMGTGQVLPEKARKTKLPKGRKPTRAKPATEQTPSTQGVEEPRRAAKCPGEGTAKTVETKNRTKKYPSITPAHHDFSNRRSSAGFPTGEINQLAENALSVAAAWLTQTEPAHFYHDNKSRNRPHTSPENLSTTADGLQHSSTSPRQIDDASDTQIAKIDVRLRRSDHDASVPPTEEDRYPISPVFSSRDRYAVDDASFHIIADRYLLFYNGALSHRHLEPLRKATANHRARSRSAKRKRTRDRNSCETQKQTTDAIEGDSSGLLDDISDTCDRQLTAISYKSTPIDNLIFMKSISP